MFAEWYKPGCALEYPIGGVGAIVDALIRGLQKYGGQLMLQSHVQEIVLEGGHAKGVKLRNGTASNYLGSFLIFNFILINVFPSSMIALSIHSLNIF